MCAWRCVCDCGAAETRPSSATRCPLWCRKYYRTDVIRFTRFYLSFGYIRWHNYKSWNLCQLKHKKSIIKPFFNNTGNSNVWQTHADKILSKVWVPTSQIDLCTTEVFFWFILIIDHVRWRLRVRQRKTDAPVIRRWMHIAECCSQIIIPVWFLIFQNIFHTQTAKKNTFTYS